jgi:O-methyltransferase involved in polyketide biosynthesis
LNLSEVSHTAILTLVCRVVATEKKDAGLNDPMAAQCLDRLMLIATQEEKNRINKWKKMYSGIQAHDARRRARTVASFDRITNLFISKHPGCNVINLACGLDTRFWRIENGKCKYIELDLPEMIDLKKEIFKDQLGYELIGCSIFEPAWIDRVTEGGNSDFLLLAEGLFMYLPAEDAARLLQEISRRFERSQFVLDMAPEKYTRGIWKRMIRLESRAWGLDVELTFGINHPEDMATFGDGFEVMGVEKGSIGPIITIAINDA